MDSRYKLFCATIVALGFAGQGAAVMTSRMNDTNSAPPPIGRTHSQNETTITIEGRESTLDGGFKTTLRTNSGTILVAVTLRSGLISSIEDERTQRKTTFQYRYTDIDDVTARPVGITTENLAYGTVSYRILIDSNRTDRAKTINPETGEDDEPSFSYSNLGSDWTFWVDNLSDWVAAPPRCDASACKDRCDALADGLTFACAALIETGPGSLACVGAMLYAKWRCRDNCESRCR